MVLIRKLPPATRRLLQNEFTKGSAYTDSTRFGESDRSGSCKKSNSKTGRVENAVGILFDSSGTHIPTTIMSRNPRLTMGRKYLWLLIFLTQFDFRASFILKTIWIGIGDKPGNCACTVETRTGTDDV